MNNNGIERARIHIIHDHAEPADLCLPGEECLAILLVFRGRRYRIPWGPTHLILGDFLCRYRWIALDAWQIAVKMADDPFVQEHGTNVPGHHGRHARTSRTAVRQQIKRMREALTGLIQEHGLPFNASDILRSEKTSSGTVGYRITLEVSWEHWPDQDEGEASRYLRPTAGSPGLPDVGHVVPIEAI
jgi:hypothetical protein